MTNNISLLLHLTKLDSETEYVEFKVNNSNKETIGKLISAISNSACLHSAEFGYIVFGVEDKTHKIVGTSFKPKAEKIGNEDLELWLQKAIDPSIHFEIKEFQYEDKNFVIFRIPACQERPILFHGQSYIRINSNIRPLKEFPEKESIIWNRTQNQSFESAVALSDLSQDEVLSLLDYPSYFRLTGKALPSNSVGIIKALTEEQFIKSEEGKFSITHLGGILLANDLSEFPSLSRKATRVIIYEGIDKTKSVKEREGKRGYAVGFENMVEYINDILPSNEEIEKILRTENKMYPDIAIRELVANALIHQDFTQRGTGPMIEIFSDRIEISNPGKPLIETDRFLDHIPQSRNEKLAAFLRRIGICEERGSGIDKVFNSVEVYQLPSPKFNENDKYLTVTMFSYKDVRDMSKEDRIRACYQHSSLRHVSNKKMTNTSLRERFKLSDSKTDMVFTSNIISDTVKMNLIKSSSDPGSRRSANYVPYWA